MTRAFLHTRDVKKRGSFRADGPSPANAVTPATAASPRVIFGPGAGVALADAVVDLGASADSAPRVLVVCGRSSAAWRDRLVRRLPHPHEVCEHAATYPTEASVAEVGEAADTCEARMIVAIGGGSVLDAAKVARVRLAERRGRRRVPLVAVPTTPGTGAEVTPFATLWDFDGLAKHSVAGPDVVPDVAIVDPELTTTMDFRDFGSSALDALVQGVEAAWSTGSTWESISLGLAAAALVTLAYKPALRRADPGARTAISLAGLHAGHAIAISETTACHAISYPLTLRYGLRHGHACSLSLAAVLTHNFGVTAADCADRRGPGHVRDVLARILRMLGADDVGAVEDRLERFRRLAGLEEYRNLDIDTGWVAAEATTYGRLLNNPRHLDPDEVVALLDTLTRTQGAQKR